MLSRSVALGSSWEDGPSFISIPALPDAESEAAPLAAELAALCPDVLSHDGPLDGFGYEAGGTIGGLARLLVNRSVWTLWWD